MRSSLNLLLPEDYSLVLLCDLLQLCLVIYTEIRVDSTEIHLDTGSIA